MELCITSYSHISGGKVIVNDNLHFYLENIPNFATFIKAVFKQQSLSYPKFYKMDPLSKLGFLAAELVMKVRPPAGYKNEEVGVVLSNSSASLDTDEAHYETIRDRSNYFPSPSVFVYTLPNIVIGEVCIRHQIKGENTFFITEAFDSALICRTVLDHFENQRMQACICGWVELMGDRHNAMVMMVERLENAADAVYRCPFTIQEMNRIFTRN